MFYVHEVRNCYARAIFECLRCRLRSKILGCGQLAEGAVYFAVFGLRPEADTKRKGRHVRWGAANSGHSPNDRDGSRSLLRWTNQGGTPAILPTYCLSGFPNFEGQQDVAGQTAPLSVA